MRMRAAVLLLAAALPLTAQTPLIDRGRALLDKGDSQGAADVLEKAVAATPNLAEAHYLLGAAYGRVAQNASIFSQASLAGKARQELLKAVQLDPNHLQARQGLVQYYLFAPSIVGGSEEEAAKQANEIKKRDALAGHRAWASIYNHRKQPDLARKELVDAVREQPASVNAHLALAAFYIGEKNYPAAATEVESARKIDANNQQVGFRIGQLAALTGTNLPAGEEALRKYLAYSPKRDELPLYRAHYWLGLVLEKEGRKADAKASYASSLRLNGEQTDVKEALKRVS
jgi:Tfp pilus assembly protein PilF